MIDEASVTDREALDLVREALRELMLRFPLAGLSYMGENIVVREESSIKTMDTDGRFVRYSPEWVRSCTDRGRVFDLLHEWLHVFGNHPARLGGRDPFLWNVAVDIVVVRQASEILTTATDNWPPPDDGIIPPAWAKDMDAETIYDVLASNANKVPAPKSAEGVRGANDLRRRDPQEAEAFRGSFASELAQICAVQQQATGLTPKELYGSELYSRLDQILKGNVPWSKLLRGQLVSELGAEEHGYDPPNRRYYPDIILPQAFDTTQRKLLIAVDVSASVGQDLLDEFIGNVVPAAARAAETWVVTFDAVVRETVKTRHPRRVLREVRFLAGSHNHTSVREVFALVDQIKPTSTVVLTDGHVLLPDEPYPKTLWIIPRGGKKQPWGRNYIMEASW
jgi:predicted metal-dependent peptidase